MSEITQTSGSGVLITRADAAERAGVGVRRIDEWRKAGKLNTYRNDVGHVRIDADQLDDVLEFRRVSA